MNYSVFGCFLRIGVDANVLETMLRQTEEKKIVFVSVDVLIVGPISTFCFVAVSELGKDAH